MQLNATMIYKTVYRVETVIDICTKNSSLVLGVNSETGELLQFYYGERLQAPSEVIPHGEVAKGQEFTAAYSAFGGADNTPALRVRHSDGTLCTELVYQSHSVKQEDDNQTVTSVMLKDKHYPFFVELNYLTYHNEDVIETWACFNHSEDGEVVLNEYPSIELTFGKRYNDYYLTTFQGLWEREHSLQEEKLSLGKKVLDNRYGTWSSFGFNPSFMLSLNEPSTETSGQVVAGALAWSGAWKITFDCNHGKLYHDTTERQLLSIKAGTDSFAADYHLTTDERFETPKFIMTYSNVGRGKVSRNFHRWARNHGLREGEMNRPIVLNSWEGAYFDFDEAKLLSMMDGVQEMGGEMFVLDDGWFGNGDCARNSSTAGLGDWQVNRDKLPNGLSYLGDEAKKRGLKFGIWMEPEMVNPKSELFKTHPEWVIHQPNREAILYRNQLLLDLTNPDVQEFVFESVATKLRETPEISYVKWDCNRSFTNVGSTYLDKDHQTHIWVDYVKGLYSVYDRLAEEFPKVIFQACASGGGRIDYGILKRNHEFWTSDNTDPMQRIFIQWGTSYLYPACAMAAHVSISPNHQTGRATPIKFRFDVAMTGRLGLELNPKQMPMEELEFAKNAVTLYKEIRPVVQRGDLYRLASPYEQNYSSLMYVTEDQKEAVLFAFNVNHKLGNNFYPIRLQGLDPVAKYKIIEVNKHDKHHLKIDDATFSGDFLMKYGLHLDLDREYDSAVFRLSRSLN